MPDAERVHVRVVRNRTELLAILPKWAQLFERDPRAEARGAPRLQYAFHQMYTPSIRPRVLVATDREGVIRGVLPLGIRLERVGPIFLRRLVPLIDRHAYFTDMLLDPELADVVGRALSVALMKLSWDHFDLKHIRSDSRLLDPETGILSGRSEFSLAQGWPAPRITLPPGELLNQRDEKDVLRRERALLRTGSIVMQWEAEGPTLLPAIRDYLRLHAELKAFQGQNKTFTIGTAERDFPAWLEAEISAGRAGFFTIRRDGTLLAGHVIFWHRGEAHSYRVAWAPHAAAFGLGILQTTRVIEACAARGDTIFDLGPGTEPYKGKWHPDVPFLIDISTSRTGWRPRSAAAWLQLRRGLRRVLERQPLE